MNRSLCLVMLILLGGTLVVTGCGGGGTVPTVPVSGTVTYQGQPVVGAQVAFVAEGAPRAATGRTDEQGSYQLTTFRENDGAVVGNHTVTISMPDERFSGEEMDASDPGEAYGAAMTAAAGGPQAGMRGGIPARYGDPRGSGLTAEVTADGPHEINFQLQ